MSLNTTTLSNAVVVTDRSIVVASASGFAANQKVVVDGEEMRITQSYVSGTTIPVLRGQNGTVTAAHPKSALVKSGDALTDFALTPVQGFGEAVDMPGATNWAPVVSYSASGAIALPTTTGISVAILLGTSTLAMTIANPTADIDGAIMIIVGSGKSASTIDFPDATGLSGATGASGYDTITFQNGGQCSLMLVACNSVWVLLGVPITGTTTALSVAIA